MTNMGEQARVLFSQGYVVEADRMLDEMIERRDRWQQGQSEKQAESAGHPAQPAP